MDKFSNFEARLHVFSQISTLCVPSVVKPRDANGAFCISVIKWRRAGVGAVGVAGVLGEF